MYLNFNVVFINRWKKMRSRSNSLEDVAKVEKQQNMDPRKRSAEGDEPPGRAERRGRRREPPDNTGTIERNNKMAKSGTGGSAGGRPNGSSSAARAGRREKGRDLSRDDLVFLLSLLEGELQVI